MINKSPVHIFRFPAKFFFVNDSDENLTYSTATTLTTTIPLIDLQNGNHPG